MLKTNNFFEVNRGNFKYLFFVVGNEYMEHQPEYHSLTAALETTFARNLGSKGAVISSFSQDLSENYQRILSKPWNDNAKNALANPTRLTLLIVAADFERFDPSINNFILICPQKLDEIRSEFFYLLYEIETIIKNNEDLFSWWEQRASAKESFIERLVDATELNPGIWGFSFNLKKFFKL